MKEMGYGGFNEELEIAHGQYLEENQVYIMNLCGLLRKCVGKNEKEK